MDRRMKFNGINEILEFGKNQIRIFCPSIDYSTLISLVQIMKAFILGQVTISDAQNQFQNATGTVLYNR